MRTNEKVAGTALYIELTTENASGLVAQQILLTPPVLMPKEDGEFTVLPTHMLMRSVSESNPKKAWARRRAIRTPTVEEITEGDVDPDRAVQEGVHTLQPLVDVFEGAAAGSWQLRPGGAIAVQMTHIDAEALESGGAPEALFRRLVNARLAANLPKAPWGKTESE